MSLSIESVRISYRVLCSRSWGAEASELDVEKFKILISKLKPFVDHNDLGQLDEDNQHSFFSVLDEMFDRSKSYAWNIMTLGISLLEVFVSSAESLANVPTDKVLSYLTVLLEHPEVRVRTAATDLIIALSTKAFNHSEALYDSLIPILLQGVVKDWTRANTTRVTLLGAEKTIQMDDTTGWNHLESYVKALHAVFVGIGRCSVTRAVQCMQAHWVTISAELYHNMLHPVTESTTTDSTTHIPTTANTTTTTATTSITSSELLLTHAALHINRHVRELTFRFIADLLNNNTNSNSNGGVSGGMPNRGAAPAMHVGYSMMPRPFGNTNSGSDSHIPTPPTTTTYNTNPIISSTTATNTTSSTPLPSTSSPLPPLPPQPAWHTLPALHTTSDRIAVALTSGLQDDWSQIRHAASMACQSFLHSLQHNTATNTTNTSNNTSNTTTNTNSDTTTNTRYSPLLDRYWSTLLPRLCMNRFYPAVAVQTVSQATWRDILGPQALGRTLLAQHAVCVVDYYCTMTQARNHMTAEAACHAIAEYAGKIEHSVVMVHVPQLLTTLLDCLHDDRWPVRDAAIVASGVVCRHYASTSAVVEALPSLLHLWSDNLTDFIWSIREHAAMAFAEAVQCGGNTVNTTNTTSTLAGSNTDSAGTDSTSSAVAVTNQQRQVFDTALQYIRAHLLHVLHHTTDDTTSNTNTSPTGTSNTTPANTTTAKATVKAPFSFLPQSLLDRDAAAKLKAQQEKVHMEGGSTDANNSTYIPDTTNTDANTRTATNSTTNTTNNNTTSTKSTPSLPLPADRKGWGCCIDCIELRTCLPWEVSHGAVYLLREMAVVRPRVLFEMYSVSDSSGGNGSSSGSAYDTLLGKFISLLTESKSDENSVVGITTGIVNSVSTSTSEAELLLVVVYEEIPVILSTALEVLFQSDSSEHVIKYHALLPLGALFASLARDLKSTSTQDLSATAPTARFTTTTYLAGSKTPLATTTHTITSTTTSSTTGTTSTTSTTNTTSTSTSAVQRRNQQVARRSARNRDKVVIAAENCVVRVFEMLCDVRYRVVLNIVSNDNKSVNSSAGGGDGSIGSAVTELEVRRDLLARFPEQMHSYLTVLMKW